ncbi:MAG: hypothetical protein H6873_05550 [Hyphomicrobiaceae bacterium]|nr:hypothetical protein [Hyphomicrobiaceae bacterium]
MSLSPELQALRDEAMRVSCIDWAMRKRWKLGPGIDRAGPCPNCGGDDRFAIHTKKNSFNCRQCGLSGGGVIDLVMKTEGLDFVKAAELITGRRADQPVDPARARRLAAEAKRAEERRAREDESYREKARREGYQIWRSGKPIGSPEGEMVRLYLERRGIGGALPYLTSASLRALAAHPWWEVSGRERVELHAGPAMLAPVLSPDGRFGAVHQTWLDLEQPKGKLSLPPDAKGRPRPAKKARGHVGGGAIRLYTPMSRVPGQGQPQVTATRIVMGEGIETTLTPLAWAFEPDTAYWAGVSLGNMAGRAMRDAAGHVVHDQPDMNDPNAFVPPGWCAELIYLSDGDDPKSHIHDKLKRGLRRAMRARPGLRGFIVPAPAPGTDMNELAMALRQSSEVGA